MGSMAESHIVHSSGYKLPFRFLSRLLAEVVEWVTIKFVSIGAKVSRVEQMYVGNCEIRSLVDFRAIVERDGLFSLSAYGKG